MSPQSVLDPTSGSGSILSDIESGETPILLTDLPSSGLVPTPRGRPLHKRVGFRWASRGCRGVKLPVVRTPSGMATTRSQVIRFLAELSGGNTAPRPSRRAAAQARRRLTKEGF